MNNKEQIRQDIKGVRDDLALALRELRSTAGQKLNRKDLEEVEKELAQVDELLRRLQTGLVWVTLFGKTSVGKSSVANSLIGEDIAEVGIQHDLTVSANTYEKSPWMLVDVPGILGQTVNETLAVEEAKKAHGHIFVIDGEPLKPELTLFETVNQACPDTPKIVFVNQWDKMQNVPGKDREKVQTLIEQKMSQFVKSPATDIIYGSSMLYDPERDVMVRQELPQLLNRLYDEAGTLGDVINVLDPAKRASDLNQNIRNRILEVRLRAARKVINGFAIATVVGGFLPFSQLLVAPGILASMVYVLCRIMASKQDRDSTTRLTKELLKSCAQVLGAEFAAVVVAETVINAAAVALGPLAALIGFGADVAGLSYYKYRRAVILGEVTLEYIRNDFSWGAEGAEIAIKRSKERAQSHYFRLSGKTPSDVNSL